MVGDISVRFIIHGPNGGSITLTREEAERCLAALTRALKATGPQSQLVDVKP
jgi:hypothetical protein